MLVNANCGPPIKELNKDTISCVTIKPIIPIIGLSATKAIAGRVMAANIKDKGKLTTEIIIFTPININQIINKEPKLLLINDKVNLSASTFSLPSNTINLSEIGLIKAANKIYAIIIRNIRKAIRNRGIANNGVAKERAPTIINITKMNNIKKIGRDINKELTNNFNKYLLPNAQAFLKSKDFLSLNSFAL